MSTFDTITDTTTNGTGGFKAAADRAAADRAKALETCRAEERALETEIGRLAVEWAARKNELKAAQKRTARMESVG